MVRGPTSPLTAGEWRKLTGKSAEIAAILVRLPIDIDFFKLIEADLLDDGLLNLENRRWIANILLQLPLFIDREELRARVDAQRDWYIVELQRVHRLDEQAAAAKAETTIAALFAGWRNPCPARSGVRALPLTVLGTGRAASPVAAAEPGPTLLTTDRNACPPATKETTSQPESLGPLVSSSLGPQRLASGVPLRAMLAYLFREVAINCYLIHHPEEWIACVTSSQMGDRSVSIDPDRLPEAKALPGDFPWEAGLSGPDKLSAWLERCGAQPYDFNLGLDAAALAAFAAQDNGLQTTGLRTAEDGGAWTEDGGQRSEVSLSAEALAKAEGQAADFGEQKSEGNRRSEETPPIESPLVRSPWSVVHQAPPHPPPPSLWRAGRLPALPIYRFTASPLHRFTGPIGGSFFRGLALIDLAEAMLKRAFGPDAIAVRVNAAGQGDFFQVHIDTSLADPVAVKEFLRVAFYRRFGLNPEPEFVETNPGGGAVGFSLNRYATIREVIGRVR